MVYYCLQAHFLLYQTLKAERDFYTKEYSKDGDISDINRKKLDDLDDEIKTLEERPEVKVVLAAIKNPENKTVK